MTTSTATKNVRPRRRRRVLSLGRGGCSHAYHRAVICGPLNSLFSLILLVCAACVTTHGPWPARRLSPRALADVQGPRLPQIEPALQVLKAGLLMLRAWQEFFFCVRAATPLVYLAHHIILA